MFLTRLSEKSASVRLKEKAKRERQDHIKTVYVLIWPFDSELLTHSQLHSWREKSCHYLAHLCVSRLDCDNQQTRINIGWLHFHVVTSFDP